ncbi:MAG: hypothetical protein ACRDYX_16425 [Egibacteraceae bacterium]
MTIDLAEVAKRQQKVWATGDFAQIAARFAIVGELLCETVDVRPGERVLDVAAGSGSHPGGRPPVVRGDGERLRARVAGGGPAPGRLRGPDDRDAGR